VKDCEQALHSNRRLRHHVGSEARSHGFYFDGETAMTRFKVLSAGLFSAAMLATPVMAQDYHHVASRADVSMSRDDMQYRRDFGAADARDCVRAPDVGAYASAPYTRPPCEPGTFY
jgi:hypothetical protein